MTQVQMTDSARDIVYSELCQAVTAVGIQNESLFLARLALLMAETLGDMPTILRLIGEAKDGMPQLSSAGPKVGEF